MSKKFANVSEVVAAREMNTPILLNLEAAVEADKNMPTITRNRTSKIGVLAESILIFLNKIGEPRTCAQICACLIKGELTEINGKPLTPKMVGDKCWALEKAGKLIRTGFGCYGPKTETETTTEETVTE